MFTHLLELYFMSMAVTLLASFVVFRGVGVVGSGFVVLVSDTYTFVMIVEYNFRKKNSSISLELL